MITQARHIHNCLALRNLSVHGRAIFNTTHVAVRKTVSQFRTMFLSASLNLYDDLLGKQCVGVPWIRWMPGGFSRRIVLLSIYNEVLRGRDVLHSTFIYCKRFSIWSWFIYWWSIRVYCSKIMSLRSQEVTVTSCQLARSARQLWKAAPLLSSLCHYP